MVEKHRCHTKHNQNSKGQGTANWFKASKNKLVKKHKSLRPTCRTCNTAHSINSNRQHLKNSFKKTHGKTKGCGVKKTSKIKSIFSRKKKVKNKK